MRSGGVKSCRRHRFRCARGYAISFIKGGVAELSRFMGSPKRGTFYMTTTHKGGEQTRREEGRVKTRISTNSRTTDKSYGKRGDEGVYESLNFMNCEQACKLICRLRELISQVVRNNAGSALLRSLLSPKIDSSNS